MPRCSGAACNRYRSGQIDAAQVASGLRPWMCCWKIRLPLALISIVPGAVERVHHHHEESTSIGIVVGFWDLFAVLVELRDDDRPDARGAVA
jgi:ABC-type amino acid transport system permease subunit